MKKLLAWLDQLWFAPMTPLTLSVCRLVTGAFAMYLLVDGRRYFVRSAAGVPEVFHPVGLAIFMNEPISQSTYNSLLGVTIFMAGLFTVGVCHRILAPIFALLFIFVLSYSNSWTMVYHTENMLAVHVLILAITPSASTLSLDASYTQESPKLARFGLALSEEGAHMKFRWPVRVLQLGATLPYVVAGFAKLGGKAGLSWAYGENLRDQITMNGLYYEVLMGGAEPITFQVYGWDSAFFAAASLTLLLEMGAPLAILHRYIGYAFVFGVMAMHWSILWIMGIPFRYQLWGCAFACFFEWDKPLAWATATWQQVQARFPKARST